MSSKVVPKNIRFDISKLIFLPGLEVKLISLRSQSMSLFTIHSDQRMVIFWNIQSSFGLSTNALKPMLNIIVKQIGFLFLGSSQLDLNPRVSLANDFISMTKDFFDDKRAGIERRFRNVVRLTRKL